PAETALAVDRHLALAAGDRLPGDERSTDQRHADALVDLLLGDGAGIRAQVQVTVPASVLAGLSDAPGQLVGLGPISAHLARLIAEDATWRRLLTDPTTGLFIDVGTTAYRPGGGAAPIRPGPRRLLRVPVLLAARTRLRHRPHHRMAHRPDRPL